MAQINHSVAWIRLHQHQRATRYLHMRRLFEQDKGRFEHMHEVLHGLLFDYSKNRITENTLDLLLDLAQEVRLSDWIDKMFSGEKINLSEDRAVLHTALRQKDDAIVCVDGNNIMPDVHQALAHALSFAEDVRQGRFVGSTGLRIRHIVNIGIGGSDLGPHMLALALRPYHLPELNIHFVSNIDGADLAQVLSGISAEETLFIVSSKSFSTPETLLNARAAKKWLKEQLSSVAVGQHMVAVTAATEKAVDFGMDAHRIFTLFDWVGGRYSSWSSIGLPLMCAIGETNFRDFLSGGQAMDEHFRYTPYRHNIPVLMALIGVWYNTFYGAHSHAIIPYAHQLSRFAAHIQQLDMESNGKQTSRNGDYLDFDTGPIIWGEEGLNCQHAFFQLLHQGSRLIPSDFIVFVRPSYDMGDEYSVLVANALAQTQALMRGKTEEEVYKELAHLPSMRRDELLPQKHFPGNQPSNTLMFDEITPFNMGMLLAMYEHKVFVQGVVWEINSFDQWGVEYGKVLAQDIEPKLNTQTDLDYDASTNGLIEFYRKIAKVR